MSKLASTIELRAMQKADLLKEIAEQRDSVAKLRMQIELKSEKDTAKHRRQKRYLARLLTVAGESKESALQPSAKTPRVPARRRSKQGRRVSPRA